MSPKRSKSRCIELRLVKLISVRAPTLPLRRTVLLEHHPQRLKSYAFDSVFLVSSSIPSKVCQSLIPFISEVSDARSKV